VEILIRWIFFQLSLEENHLDFPVLEMIKIYSHLLEKKGKVAEDIISSLEDLEMDHHSLLLINKSNFNKFLLYLILVYFIFRNKK